jgi:hypothetical protein
MKRFGLIILLLMLSMLTGCLSFIPVSKQTIREIPDDFKCEYRIGKNAKTSKTTVDTDVVFDRDRFIELYNEDSKYNPTSLKYHLDRCELKIDSREEPEEWNKIFSSEINIRAVFDGTYRGISIYEYDSKLYLFELCMGGNSKPEEIGYYYKEIPEDMAEYWRPILEKIREDAAKEADDDL